MSRVSPASTREALGARARRFLQGNDVFISYARADSAEYALALASELTKRKLQCYLDQWGTPPGPLSAAVLQQLGRSSMLVVVGSAAAGLSPNVAAEVEQFLKTGRPIVPVNVDGALERAQWFALIRGISLTFETRDAFLTGRPAASVLTRIENAEGFTRRNKQLRRAFWATAASIGLIIAIGAIAVVQGRRDLGRARKATELEMTAASILAAFPSGTGELPALRTAVRAAGELHILAPRVSRPAEYPIVTPILALETVLDRLHEKIDFDTQGSDVTAVDISPDGRYVAIAEGDGYIGGKFRIFVRQTDGTAVAQWDGGSGGANDVRFVDSGQHLAILPASGDQSVRVYDLTGKPVSTWSAGTRSWVPAEDRRTFGLMRWKGGPQIVNTSGVEIRGGLRPDAEIQEITPSGEIVAVRGSALYVYNGGEIAMPGEDGDVVTGAHLLPDGNIVAITPKSVRVVSRTGSLMKRWDTGANTIAAAFAPNLPVFATAGQESVSVWSATGEQRARFVHPGGRISSVGFSPNGDRIIVTAVNGSMSVWDLMGKRITDLSGHRAVVSALRFDADGRQLLTASRDGSVRLWAMGKDSEQRISVGSAGLLDVAFRTDGSLATLDSSGTVRVWTREGHAQSSLYLPLATGQPSQPARPGHYANGGLSNDATQAGVSETYTGQTLLWRISTTEAVEEHRMASAALHLEIDAVHGAACAVPPGGGAMIQSSSGAVRVSPAGGWLYSCAFSPDGTIVATVGADSNVRLWSMKGTQLSQFHTDQLQTLDVDFSPDGATLAVAGGDGTIRIYRRDGSEMARCSGHTGRILGVRFSPDGSRLASIGMDNTVRVWDVAGRQIAQFETIADPVIHEVSGGDSGHRGIAFSHTGDRLAVGSASGTVYVWPIESLPQLIERGQKWLAVSALARHDPTVTQRR